MRRLSIATFMLLMTGTAFADLPWPVPTMPKCLSFLTYGPTVEGYFPMVAPYSDTEFLGVVWNIHLGLAHAQGALQPRFNLETVPLSKKEALLRDGLSEVVSKFDESFAGSVLPVHKKWNSFGLNPGVKPEYLPKGLKAVLFADLPASVDLSKTRLPDLVMAIYRKENKYLPIGALRITSFSPTIVSPVPSPETVLGAPGAPPQMRYPTAHVVAELFLLNPAGEASLLKRLEFSITKLAE